MPCVFCASIFSQSLLLIKHLDLREDFVQKDRRPNEINYMLAMNKLLTDTEFHMWQQDNLSLDQKKAYGLWVWQALRIEWVEHKKSKDHDFFPDILQFLFLCGFQIFTRQFANQNELELPRKNAKEYLDWLAANVVDLSSNVPSHFVGGISSRITEFFIKMIDEPEEKLDHDSLIFLITEYILLLPTILRDGILNDHQFSQKIGRELIPTLSIFGYEFKAYDFWNAAEKACNEGNGHVEVHNGDGHLELTRKLNIGEAPILGLSGIKEEDWRDPIFRLLSNDMSHRQSFFDEQPKTLDYPPDIRQKKIQEIIGIESSPDRIHRWQDIDQDSADSVYQRLRQGMADARRTRSIDRNLFFTPVDQSNWSLFTSKYK